MEAEPQLDSDISSIISTSSRPMASDSEGDGVDTFKYRLPDHGKTRLHPRSIPIPIGGSYTGSNGTSPFSPPGARPPTPPPKDEEPSSAVSGSTTVFDPSIYFNPHNTSRTMSVYTLSRVSFTNQISQLTSIKLPDASSLSSSIEAIPSSPAAARALNDAAEAIKRWIKKASEVLNGLDAEDDVEWAAAGGREGLDEVDTAIMRFEALIEIYVMSIEQVQLRPDIGTLHPKELETLVERMESILNDWQNIKTRLDEVKEQVQLAMRWEELWNTILGEIGAELEALGRFVYEMEERRHRAVMVDVMGENKLDLKELETIVEEAPSRNAANKANNRLSIAEFSSQGPQSQSIQETEERVNANIVQVVARMQPLRAALDFCPMHLATFTTRGAETFPTACDDLERRREQLEQKYQKLDSDVEALQRELGEDRWVVLFRNSGRQMLKMCESVSRSMAKVRDGLEDGEQHKNAPSILSKIENYEQKRTHYGTAITRVTAIVDKGVRDRLTVNGEILNLQKDMKHRWVDLEAEMKAMDFVLAELNISKSNLRDSISTILSMDRSSVASAVDTPGSSPASSVVLMSRKSSEYGQSGVGTPGTGRKSRQGSFASSTKTQIQTGPGRRHSSLPVAKNYGKDYVSPYSQKTNSRSISSSISEAASSNSSLSLSPRFSATSTTPTQGNRRPVRPSALSEASKPRWNSSTNMKDTAIGHNFVPLSATTPSPHRKDGGTPTTSRPPTRTARSALPLRSPLSPLSGHDRPPSRSGANSAASDHRPPSRLSLAAAATAMASSNGHASKAPQTPGTASKISAPRVRGPAASVTQLAKANRAASSSIPSSTSTAPIAKRSVSANVLPSTPGSGDTDAGAEAGDESPSVKAAGKTPRPARPASVAGGRRSSMLPTPRGKKVEEEGVRKGWR